MKRSDWAARVVLAMLVLIASIGTAVAGNYQGTDRQDAYATCQTSAANAKAIGRNDSACAYISGASPYYRCTWAGGAYTCDYNAPATSTIYGAHYYPAGNECPPPKVWNESAKLCFDPDECSKRNQEPGFFNVGDVVKPFVSKCVAGCTFAAQPPYTETLGVVSGTFEFTGATCNDVPPMSKPDAAKKPPQECTPVAGQTLCVKPNGDNCYTASTGRQICWKPGETGEKNDGDIRQKRDAGPNPIPPANLQLPSGDSLTQKGNPATTTTTTTNPGGSTSSITTTTTNYGTANGTNANGGNTGSGTGSNTPNAGEPNTGLGNGTDKNGNSASGGGDCKSPPIVTGDQALGMVATQAWQTRCAVEAGNAAKVTGDVGDCSKPFTVEGTNANAEQLRAMRAMICNTGVKVTGDVGNCQQPFTVEGTSAEAVKLRGLRAQICDQPGWTKTDGTEPGDGDPGNDHEPATRIFGIGADRLDVGGFLGGGSGNCPRFGTVSLGPFATVNLDEAPWWCTLVSILRAVILIYGAYTALRILMGGV